MIYPEFKYVIKNFSPGYYSVANDYEFVYSSTKFNKNNSRYRFWYTSKNSTFQYDQRMSKYPFDVRFWLTVSNGD